MRLSLLHSSLVGNLLTLAVIAISETTIALIEQAAFAGNDRDRLLASLLPGVEIEETPVSLGTIRISDAFAAVPQTLAQGRELVTVSGTPAIVTLDRPYILLQMMPRNTQHAPGYTGTYDLFASLFDLSYGVSTDDLTLLDNVWPYSIDPYYYDARGW